MNENKIVPLTHIGAVQPVPGRTIASSKRGLAPVTPLYIVPQGPRQNVTTCPRCHCPVTTYEHGWLAERVEGSYGTRSVPCPICSPSVFRARDRRKTEQWIHALVRDSKLLNDRNLPVEADKLAFEKYPRRGDQAAKKSVQQFIDGSLPELLLTGDVGRGKSGLAISAVKELASKGAQVLFLSMKQYIALLQENFDKGAIENHIRDVARLVEVLVIDDMGTERVTDTGFTVEETQELVEWRHNSGKRTLITTNYSLSGLEAYWHMPKYDKTDFQPGKRIVSRLQGWYKVVTLTGPDLRIGK